MIITFILLSFILLCLFAFITTRKPKKYPPGPAWLPFIGSSIDIQNMGKKYGSEYHVYLELSRQYSTKVIGLKTTSEFIVVVFGEKNVRHVFSSVEFDARPQHFFAQLRCLGMKNMGITFANGEVWKEQRQFTLKNLKHVGYGKTSMEIEIQNELSRILDHLKNNCNKPVNLINLLSESVMNVLWIYVAGELIPGDKLRHLLHLLRQRGKAFSMAGGLLNQMPWCRYIIPELSGYSLITRINQEIVGIIEDAINRHKTNEVKGHDFIYLFLKEIAANNRSTFTEEQLKIVCLDLLIAGSQTSSNVLSFALLKALKCQDIQDKIINEIDSVIGDRTPSWQDNERLVYTAAFILEVHRYYMIVPVAGPRLVQTDTVIDGYLIPKGSTVLISLGDIYFDPELWEEPNVFRPERFIDKDGNLINSNHLYFFGLGRRRCPGDALAKSFIFITLVGILQKYRIQCSNGTMPSDVPTIGLLSSPKPFTAEFIPRK